MIRNINVAKWSVYTLVFFLTAVLQFTPSLFPKILQVGPLLLIPMVICMAMFEGEIPGAVFGIIAGLIWDTQSSRIFGFDAFFLLVFGLLSGLLIKFIFRNTLLTSLLFTLVISLALEFITWFFFFNLFGDSNISFAFLNIILPTVCYTLLLTAPIYYIIKKLNKKLTFEE